MKYTYIGLLLLLLLLFISLFLINPVSAYSKTAPYAEIQQGTANWGDTDREFIQTGHDYRIRQNGTIYQIRFDVADVSNLEEFYFTVWRKNENSHYDRVGITGDLSSYISNGINIIDLPHSMEGILEGDYYGARIEVTGNALYVDDYNQHIIYYVDNYASTTQNFNWGAQDYSLATFVIEPYMESPYMVFIGNSIISGFPDHVSFIEFEDYNDPTNIQSTIENQWSGKVGKTYQNMGYSGQETYAISGRFQTDVIDLSPEFVLIEGGVNDVNSHHYTASQICDNWEDMIDAAIDVGVTPVIMLILPENDHSPDKDYGTDEDLMKIDEVNEGLISLAEQYPPSIVVDARSYVGTERDSGPDGNYWDINPIYDSGDGIHFNAEGYGRIAQAIKDSFIYLYGGQGINNLVQSDGTIIYSKSIVGGVKTSWRMASSDSTASVSYSDPSSHEIARFTINSGTVDWFSISDLSSGQVYYLRNSDGTFIENSTAINEIVNFTTDISHGTYYVNYNIPDTLDPVILTATADPDEIEADGKDTTLLNVTAIDIDSGIASVTINLLALNGPPGQSMTNNSGVWQYIVNTTIIGDHILPVTVIDNAGNSNTSVNILLNASDTISPVISCPADRPIELNSSGNITWNITEIHPDKYWILRNNIQIIPPSPYENGDNIIIPIDTYTPGTWDYIIFASDGSGGIASDQVTISIISSWRDEWMGKNTPGGSAVTTSELQDAIHHWLENLPVKDHILSTPDLQEVIAVWLSE